MLCGLNKLDSEYSSHLFENLSQTPLKAYTGLEMDKNMVQSLDSGFNRVRTSLDTFYFTTMPNLFWQGANSVQGGFAYVRENLAFKETIQKVIAYRPAFMLKPDTQPDEQKSKYDAELGENLNLLKEKFLAEILANLKTNSNNNQNNNEESNSVEQIKKELDQKFNYTFTLMSNRVSEQLMDIESSKSSHDREIQQMKSVLSDIEHKYDSLLKQLEEQQKIILEQQKQQQITGMQQQQQQQVVPSPSTANYEYISFEKIEEFINKSFYLYNADKTGMTDFASELVGASILFTRCAEAYEGNTRWLSFFDFPITRVHVSPRVVIQVVVNR